MKKHTGPADVSFCNAHVIELCNPVLPIVNELNIMLDRIDYEVPDDYITIPIYACSKENIADLIKLSNI